MCQCECACICKHGISLNYARSELLCIYIAVAAVRLLVCQSVVCLFHCYLLVSSVSYTTCSCTNSHLMFLECVWSMRLSDTHSQIDSLPALPTATAWNSMQQAEASCNLAMSACPLQVCTQSSMPPCWRRTDLMATCWLSSLLTPFATSCPKLSWPKQLNSTSSFWWFLLFIDRLWHEQTWLCFVFFAAI